MRKWLASALWPPSRRPHRAQVRRSHHRLAPQRPPNPTRRQRRSLAPSTRTRTHARESPTPPPEPPNQPAGAQEPSSRPAAQDLELLIFVDVPAKGREAGEGASFLSRRPKLGALKSETLQVTSATENY